VDQQERHPVNRGATALPGKNLWVLLVGEPEFFTLSNVAALVAFPPWHDYHRGNGRPRRSRRTRK
jgi:hypothetical protein